MLNRQREVIYGERREVLEGADLHEQIRHFLDDVVRAYVAQATARATPRTGTCDQLWTALKTLYPVGITVEELLEEAGGDAGVTQEMLVTELTCDAQLAYDGREEALGEEAMRELERRVVLSVLDRKWREHLYEMDYLQEGIGLRAMAQRDPLVEYQREGYLLFQAMTEAIKEESVGYLFNLEVEVEQPAEEEEQAQGEGATVLVAKGLVQPAAAGPAAVLGAHGGRRAAAWRPTPKATERATAVRRGRARGSGRRLGQPRRPPEPQGPPGLSSAQLEGDHPPAAALVLHPEGEGAQACAGRDDRGDLPDPRGRVAQPHGTDGRRVPARPPPRAPARAGGGARPCTPSDVQRTSCAGGPQPGGDLERDLGEPQGPLARVGRCAAVPHGPGAVPGGRGWWERLEGQRQPAPGGPAGGRGEALPVRCPAREREWAAASRTAACRR